MSNKFTAGYIVNQGCYRAFIPDEINKPWEINDMEVFHLLSQADRSLGRLDMYSEHVNIDLFVSAHTANEKSDASAYKLIGKLEGIGVLKEITGGKRNKRYVFDEYIRLFDI